MGIPCDDVVLITQSEKPGDPSVITVNCPDKTGLGLDLCRIILFFGLSIVKGDLSTDGKWCYVVFWVVEKSPTRWSLLKKRLLGACPSCSSASGIYYYRTELETPKPPDVFLLKFCCYDRRGLLHNVTEVLCELELTIKRVKVSTTPDGRVIDLLFITDSRFYISYALHCCSNTNLPKMYVNNDIVVLINSFTPPWELLHTKKRREEILDHMKEALGDALINCEIEMARPDIVTCSLGSSILPNGLTQEMFGLEMPNNHPSGSAEPNNVVVTMDNSLSPAHTLIQIICIDHKGLLYDIMRTLKDYNIQISYGRFSIKEGRNCEVELFVMQVDGKKLLDPNKQNSLCSRLRMELSHPLKVAVVSRGPDTELLVANPVDLSGKGRPLVFFDITLALKMLDTCIFSAEIARHVISDREWEVYRILLDEGDGRFISWNKIENEVRRMLMGWDRS